MLVFITTNQITCKSATARLFLNRDRANDRSISLLKKGSNDHWHRHKNTNTCKSRIKYIKNN